MLRLISVVVVVVANVGLGLAVFLRNRRNPSHRAFAVAAIAIAVWLTLALFADQHIQPIRVVLLFNRLTLGAALVMGAALLHFTRVFPRRDDRGDMVWRLVYAATLLLAVIAASTGLVVGGVRFTPAGSDILAGPLLWLVAVWAVTALIGLVVSQRRKLRGLSGRERTQARLMLLGTVTFAGTSVLFGLLLPMLLGTYAISYIAYFAPLFFIGFTAYGMIRHRLMDVRLVALRFAAYAGLVAALGAFLVLVAEVARSRFVVPEGIGPDALFVGAALVAVFVFQPLRVSLDRLTDRFLYRRTYDPQQVLQRVGSHLTAALDMRAFASALAADLAGEMRLTFAVVAFEEADAIGSAFSGRTLPDDEIDRIVHLEPHDGRVVFADDEEADPAVAAALAENGVRVLVPLMREHALLGAVMLGAKQSGDMYSTADAAFLEVLAPEAALAMVNAKLYIDLEHTFLGTIAALAAAADAKDSRGVGQVHEVTEYCAAIALEMGMPEAERETLRTAAMLHDIGEIGVDGGILEKPGRLTDEEAAAVRSHPDVAANILAPLRFLADALPLVRHHHERWDGTGYPSGLAGEDIPLGARIVAVADAYHAMTSARADRDGLGHDAAVVELYAGAGTQFDPAVVDAMLAVLSRWHGHAGERRARSDVRTA